MANETGNLVSARTQPTPYALRPQFPAVRADGAPRSAPGLDGSGLRRAVNSEYLGSFGCN